jgi:hypothetical protein
MWPKNDEESNKRNVDMVGHADDAPLSFDTEVDRKIRSVALFWTNFTIKTPAHDHTIGIELNDCSRLEPRCITTFPDELPPLPCAGLSLHRLQLFTDIQDQDITDDEHFCSGWGLCTYETGHQHLPRNAAGFISRLDFERSLSPWYVLFLLKFITLQRRMNIIKTLYGLDGLLRVLFFFPAKIFIVNSAPITNSKIPTTISTMARAVRCEHQESPLADVVVVSTRDVLGASPGGYGWLSGTGNESLSTGSRKWENARIRFMFLFCAK